MIGIINLKLGGSKDPTNDAPIEVQNPLIHPSNIDIKGLFSVRLLGLTIEKNPIINPAVLMAASEFRIEFLSENFNMTCII
jgi:hypothetical protein